MSSVVSGPLNLQADVSGDPTIFVKAMHRMSCPDIMLHFPQMLSITLNLLLVPLNISTE